MISILKTWLISHRGKDLKGCALLLGDFRPIVLNPGFVRKSQAERGLIVSMVISHDNHSFDLAILYP